MANQVKFYRGAKATYTANPTNYTDGIYFTTDENNHVIILNEKVYGISSDDATKLNKAIATVDYDAETGVITFADNDSTTTNLLVTIGLAATDKNGLMSKEDKSTLDTLKGEATVEGSVKKQIADAKTELKGAASDTKDSETISGAKKYADDKVANLDFADDVTDRNKKYVSKVSETDGVISVEHTNLISSTDLVLKTNDAGELVTSLNLVYDENAKTITLTGKSVEGELGSAPAVLATISTEDFVRDGMLQGTEIKENPEGKPAGTYIIFTWNTDGGSKVDYLNVTRLIDVYKAGNGLELATDNKTFSVKKDNTSESFLTVGPDGVKLSGVQLAINEAKAAANTKVVHNTSNAHVTVTGTTATDGSTTYTITEADIASADDLAEEISRSTTADTKHTEAITKLNGGDTVEGSVDYKIKAAKTTIDAYTVNTKAISGNPVLTGADIVLDGYAAVTNGSLLATDTINQAFNKLDNALTWHEAQ